jgi:hypothetical protein
MEMLDNTANPQTIARCERIIRPHIRRTPVIEVNGDEFGLPAAALSNLSCSSTRDRSRRAAPLPMC